MRSTDASPETHTTRSSPNIRIPLEIVEMITTHLIYDTRSLLACSLTCFSWYIAAVTHLYHTFTIQTYSYPWSMSRGGMWPRPLLHLHKLGLIPLVKKLHIHHESPFGAMSGYFPETFHRHDLHQLLALANLQELGIEHLNISEFILRFRRYFGHFLPMLRSLALREPKCSRRQIIYFIGLFQHLEDLKLVFSTRFGPNFQEESANKPTLAPSFTPPLRGRLTMRFSEEVELLKDMISLFDGLRFHYMDLNCVDGEWLLLDACAGTLETLWLYRPGG